MCVCVYVYRGFDKTETMSHINKAILFQGMKF